MRINNANRLQELMVLYKVAYAGTEASNIDSLMEQALSLLGETFYPNIDFGIGLVDGKAQHIDGYTCLQGKYERLTFPLGLGIAGRVIKTGKAERIADVSSDPDYVRLFPGLKSELCVPIKTGERVLGVILAESDQTKAFSYTDEQLMSTFAGQLATAIEKTRLQQETKRAAERWSIFSKTTREISASLKVEEVFQAIHNAATQLMPWDSFLISLVDESGMYLEDVYLVEEGQLFPPARYPVNEGLSSMVIKSGQSLHIDDFEQEKTEVEPIVVGVLLTRSIIIVPMIVKGKVIGILSVQSSAPNAFSSQDKELLELLASYAASAVVNAQLYAEVQRLAITDSLTGLNNRRQFFDLAEQEINRIRRFNHPLSIIMFDIDYFKRVNDTCGHQVGDKVLRKIAKRSQQIVRSTDILARYGGEEFVILLIETDLEEAVQIAERLRIELAKMEIPSEDCSLSITASFGVAHITEYCQSSDCLLKCADHALYDAKRSGRNRVMVYSHD